MKSCEVCGKPISRGRFCTEVCRNTYWARSRLKDKMQFETAKDVAVAFANRANQLVRIHGIKSFTDDKLEIFEDDNRMVAMRSYCLERFNLNITLSATKVEHFTAELI